MILARWVTDITVAITMVLSHSITSQLANLNSNSSNVLFPNSMRKMHFGTRTSFLLLNSRDQTMLRRVIMALTPTRMPITKSEMLKTRQMECKAVISGSELTDLELA